MVKVSAKMIFTPNNIKKRPPEEGRFLMLVENLRIPMLFKFANTLQFKNY